MYLEESLMPPSAFLESHLPKPTSIDQRHLYSLGFDRFQIPNNNHVNKFSQTDNTKTYSSKASLTSETVITLDEVNERIREKKVKYVEKMNSLKQQHLASKSEMNELIENLNKQLSESLKENCYYEEELNKMKYYITGIEDRESWLQEKQKLLREINNLELSSQEQQSIVNGLKIQLSNMEKIQSIQERELEKDIVKSHTHNLLSHEVRYESLLRAWRHKVLALLVQQESSDVLVKKDRQQLKVEIQEREIEIDHLRSELEVISLKLQSNEAQLLSRDIAIEQLKRDNADAHRQIESINQENVNHQSIIDSIYDRLEQFQIKMESDVEIKLQKSNSKLDILHRRLQYAASRFPMIQSAVIRLQNKAKTQSDNIHMAENFIPSDNLGFKIRELEEALLMTNREMQQLRSERDQLIVTIEKDSATFNDRINAKKLELDEEMNRLQSSVIHLDKSLNKSLRELEAVKNENIRFKSSHDELLTEKYNETESLQAALFESRNDVSTLSLEFSEFKRISERENNKLEERMHQCEQTLSERESFWAKHVDQLNAECNLLKMTIRQEGILSKLKNKATDSKLPLMEKSHRENHQMECVMKEVQKLTNELLISDEI